MTLKQRIEHLENNAKGQEPEIRLAINIDDIIRKVGLDPDKVSAAAKEKNQSRAEIMAAELGISYNDLLRELESKTQRK